MEAQDSTSIVPVKYQGSTSGAPVVGTPCRWPRRDGSTARRDGSCSLVRCRAGCQSAAQLGASVADALCGARGGRWRAAACRGARASARARLRARARVFARVFARLCARVCAGACARACSRACACAFIARARSPHSPAGVPTLRRSSPRFPSPSRFGVSGPGWAASRRCREASARPLRRDGAPGGPAPASQ